jgi:hypothetical protein
MQTIEAFNQLCLRKDGDEYGYFLDGRAVRQGDVLEAFFAASGWVQGVYTWSGRVEFSPRLNGVGKSQNIRGFTASTKCRWPLKPVVAPLEVDWHTLAEAHGLMRVEGELERHVMVIRGPHAGHWRVSIHPRGNPGASEPKAWPVFEVRFSLAEAKEAAIHAVKQRRGH